jgi:hypothetical protein
MRAASARQQHPAPGVGQETLVPLGGHYAAHTDPDLVIQDLRQFFASVPS